MLHKKTEQKSMSNQSRANSKGTNEDNNQVADWDCVNGKMKFKQNENSFHQAQMLIKLAKLH